MDVETRFDLPQTGHVWVGTDGKAYSNIGRWTLLDREDWPVYTMIGHYQSRGMSATIEFTAPDDAAARAIAARLMRRFPISAKEVERETIRWCREHGCRVERALVVYEKAHPEKRAR